jgi:predicted permease
MATAINRFVFYIAIPALGFKLIIHAPLEEFSFALLSGFFISELAIYGAGFAVGRFLFNADVKEAVLLGLACALTNHIMFVLPIAVTLFGEEAAAPIVAIITMDVIVLFSVTLIIMEIMSSQEGSIKEVLGKICRNPPVMAMVSGLAVAISNIEVPKSFDVFLDFSGAAAAPCALFSMGIILSQRQEPGRALLPVVITAIKLLIHPALAWLLLVTFLDLPMTVAAPAMMVAAAPCGAMSFVLALNYKVRVDAISRAILYSSIGSLVTITLAAVL